VLDAIEISEWMGGSVGCELTDWYMLERAGVTLMGFILGGGGGGSVATVKSFLK
jgi:hypothetical protein